MPLTNEGQKVMGSMEKTYGPEKAEEVFYASINKGNPGTQKWHKKRKKRRAEGHGKGLRVEGAREKGGLVEKDKAYIVGEKGKEMFQAKQVGRYTQAPTGRARGGPVEEGKSFVVGEKGPEIFKPNQDGEIIPNNELRAKEEGPQTIKVPRSKRRRRRLGHAAGLRPMGKMRAY